MLMLAIFQKVEQEAAAPDRRMSVQRAAEVHAPPGTPRTLCTNPGQLRFAQLYLDCPFAVVGFKLAGVF